jgi:hypothetical protein
MAQSAQHEAWDFHETGNFIAQSPEKPAREKRGITPGVPDPNDRQTTAEI